MLNFTVVEIWLIFRLKVGSVQWTVHSRRDLRNSWVRVSRKVDYSECKQSVDKVVM